MSAKIGENAVAESLVSRRRRLFRRLFVALYVAMVPAVILLQMEFYVRWKLRSVESHNALIQSSLRRYAHLQEATDQSLWTPARNRYRSNAQVELEVEGESHSVSINDHGFRAGHIPVPKPEGTFRIVCLGGSTTVEGPTNQSTYPALLQQKLQDHFGDQRIEVINCGISGLGSLDEVTLLTEIFKFDPDWVIEYNAVNDLCWRIIPELYQQAPLWQKMVRNSRLVARKWNSIIEADPADIARLWDQYTFQNLEMLDEMCRQRGIKLLLGSFCYPRPETFTPEQRDYFAYNLRSFWGCPWTSYAEYCRMIDIYNAKLRIWCERRGTAYLPIQETVPGYPEYFVDICHMTLHGIEAKAEAMFIHLRDEPSLPPNTLQSSTHRSPVTRIPAAGGHASLMRILRPATTPPPVPHRPTHAPPGRGGAS